MDEKIHPDRVTKPIQLLAAWLVGLITVNASFLAAARMISRPDWVSGVLAIAAIANVPIFLVSLFLLQTRFRPEMQEDTYYAKYLEVQQATRKPENAIADVNILRATIAESNTRTIETVQGLQVQVLRLAEQMAKLDIEPSDANRNESIAVALKSVGDDLVYAKHDIRWQAARVLVNDLLPRYEMIVRGLHENRIPIHSTFGSTSFLPERPDHYVIGFGSKISIARIQELLEAIRDTAPEYLVYNEEEVSQTNLYIGGYNYGRMPTLKLSSAVIQSILDPALTIEALRERITASGLRLNPKVLQPEIGLAAGGGA